VRNHVGKNNLEHIDKYMVCSNVLVVHHYMLEDKPNHIVDILDGRLDTNDQIENLVFEYKNQLKVKTRRNEFLLKQTSSLFVFVLSIE